MACPFLISLMKSFFAALKNRETKSSSIAALISVRIWKTILQDFLYFFEKNHKI
jgi:hypothetical protein